MFELHAEVHRHKLIQSEGEEGILDSVEAVCLSVVQNYTMITNEMDETPSYRMVPQKRLENGEVMKLIVVSHSFIFT